MQLTDDEIREILIREKRRKILRQRRKRRNTLILILLLIIIIIVAALIIRHSRKSSPEQSDAAAAREPIGTVFIDPGHGGQDPGSDNGSRYEKDDVLKLSLAVRDKLTELGLTVKMSREKDADVDRSERSKMANDSGAGLMISIHRNQAEDGSGVEAFIPAADTPESRLLAENIVKALAGVGFEEREVRAGTISSTSESFEEIAGATMPAALIEVGFIDSESDNALFDNNADAVASAIANAIYDSYRTIYPEQKEGEQSGS